MAAEASWRISTIRHTFTYAADGTLDDSKPGLQLSLQVVRNGLLRDASVRILLLRFAPRAVAGAKTPLKEMLPSGFEGHTRICIGDEQLFSWIDVPQGNHCDARQSAPLLGRHVTRG